MVQVIVAATGSVERRPHQGRCNRMQDGGLSRPILPEDHLPSGLPLGRIGLALPNDVRERGKPYVGWNLLGYGEAHRPQRTEVDDLYAFDCGTIEMFEDPTRGTRPHARPAGRLQKVPERAHHVGGQALSVLDEAAARHGGIRSSISY